MKLKLADELHLPVETVTQTIAILAKRRAGKSYTMRRLTEQLFQANQQIVLVDPKGDQWGIRSAADGKGPGLSVIILGGERGDVPLEPSSGEIVAKLVVEERVSILLDLSLFRKHEVATFMTAFLENLYRLKAREIYRTPMMLVIDEADAVAPQKPQKGEERMLGAAEDIVRRGGQRGIGCVLVTQRSAVLNKNVLTQAQVLVALRTIAPQDLAAMDAWIQVHGEPEQRKTLMESLPSLPVGDAWFWSPGWPTVDGIFKRVHVLPIETFDSGATPKPGVKPIEPKHAADVDLEALKRQMAATIEKAKQDDPRELRKELVHLKGMLRDRDKMIERLEQDIKDLKSKRTTKEVPLFKERDLRRLEVMNQKAFEMMERLDTIGEQFKRECAVLVEGYKATQHIVTDPFKPRHDVSRPVPTRPPMRMDAHTSALYVEGLSGAKQRVLNALAELEVLGAQTPERVQVAFLAGYTNLNSKGFTNAIGALRSQELIDYPGTGTIRLTSTGQAAAQYPDQPRSSQEIQQRVIRLLGGASERLLAPLIERYPKSIARDELAGLAGYTNVNSKGFTNAIGRLRTLGFIDYPSQGMVAAQPVLFLEER